MLGRLLAGLVGVKTEHDFVDKTLQDPRLMIGEGGPLRGHNVFNSSFKQADQIELAFAHNGTVCFDQRAFGLVQSEQNPALLKKGRFWRVHIFRGFRVRFE